jgi:FkbM family methyltransferase
MTLRRYVRRHFNRVSGKLGFELRRLTLETSDERRLAALLRTQRIDTVVDVGANRGQYAQHLRDLAFAGDILSFEPQEEAHQTLTRVAKDDARWHVAPRMALGEEDGEVTLNVSANSFSSSTLRLDPRHEAAAPESKVIGTERVRISRFDSVASELLGDAPRRLFLKLDVQGAEPSVLRGAEGWMDRVQGVQCELSLVTLYEGQALYREVIDAMVARGFELFAWEGGFTDRSTGRLLQADGIFFRPEEA